RIVLRVVFRERGLEPSLQQSQPDLAFGRNLEGAFPLELPNLAIPHDVGSWEFLVQIQNLSPCPLPRPYGLYHVHRPSSSLRVQDDPDTVERVPRVPVGPREIPDQALTAK